MHFLVKDLKFFLHSIQKNQINQIHIRSHQLDIIVNREKSLDVDNVIKNKKTVNTFKPINTSLKNEKSHSNYSIHEKSIIKINTDQNEGKTYSTIISPMVGTFYQSPAPNESPFIKKGDLVEKKQIVCIIEAMKLMNEIEAEVTGEIVDILVNDGDIVDCGQALMKVKI